MPTITLETIIKAPKARCFDLSRSIELHSISTSKTKEKAIGGRTKGLINEGETVTWEATHFGIRQQLKTRILSMQPYDYFVDIQEKGAFKSLHHLHEFITLKNECTLMKDTFKFQSPASFLGKLFDHLILFRYMKNFLKKRNEVIKKYAESDLWKDVLKIKSENPPVL